MTEAKLQRLRSFLFVGFLSSAYFVWPLLSRWAWGAPMQDLNFSDYIKKGATAPWVHLHDVYIDCSNRVKTKMVKSGETDGTPGTTYFPLRSGPDDQLPVRAFVKLVKPYWVDPDGVALLSASPPEDRQRRPGESFDDAEKRRHALLTRSLQDLYVGRLRGYEFSGDVESILGGGKLPKESKLVLLEQDLNPPATSYAILLFALPSACLAALILTFVIRHQGQASSPALK